MKENNYLFKEQGITLIALVVTIVVLLILAGVSIALLTGENGVLTQADNAQQESEQSALIESKNLLYMDYDIVRRTGTKIEDFLQSKVNNGEITQEEKDDRSVKLDLLAREYIYNKNKYSSEEEFLNEKNTEGEIASTEIRRSDFETKVNEVELEIGGE